MGLRDAGLLLGITFPLVIASCGDSEDHPAVSSTFGKGGSAGKGGSTSKGGSSSAGEAGASPSDGGTGGELPGGNGGQPAGEAGTPGSSSGGAAGGDGDAGAGGTGPVCGDESLVGGILCFEEPYGITTETGTPIDVAFSQWQGETGVDLAILSSDGKLSWFGTHENGTFGIYTFLADVSGAAGVVLDAGRLDSGPGPDLIAGGDTSTTDIFFGTNAGDITDTQFLVGEGTATNLFVADLPGSPAGEDFVSVRDGYAVLHVTTGSTGAGWLDESVYLYSGYPLAGDTVLAELGASSLHVAVSRLDQGSILSAQVIWGDTVTLGNATPTTIEGPASAFDVGDFDEDGSQDIVAALVGPTHLNVLFGDGEGGFKTFGSDSFKSVDAGPWLQDVKVGDFNGDGHDDIVASSRQNDSVVVIVGDGAGGFAAPVEVPLGAGADPSRLEVAELDEDGVDDIAVVTASDLKIILSDP